MQWGYLVRDGKSFLGPCGGQCLTKSHSPWRVDWTQTQFQPLAYGEKRAYLWPGCYSLYASRLLHLMKQVALLSRSVWKELRVASVQQPAREWGPRLCSQWGPSQVSGFRSGPPCPNLRWDCSPWLWAVTDPEVPSWAVPRLFTHGSHEIITVCCFKSLRFDIILHTENWCLWTPTEILRLLCNATEKYI